MCGPPGDEPTVAQRCLAHQPERDLGECAEVAGAYRPASVHGGLFVRRDGSDQRGHDVGGVQTGSAVENLIDANDHGGSDDVIRQ